jgi:hypothetical protein
LIAGWQTRAATLSTWQVLASRRPAQQRGCHFAYFRITSEADFNALFMPGGHSGDFMMSNAANAYITTHRDYPSFLRARRIPFKISLS